MHPKISSGGYLQVVLVLDAAGIPADGTAAAARCSLVLLCKKHENMLPGTAV